VNGTTQLRMLTSDDAEALLELSNVCDIATIGEATTTLEEVHADMSNPHLATVGIEASGSLVGYAWTEARPGQTRVWADVRALPAHETSLLGALLDWAKEHAAQIGPGRPLWVFANATSETKRTLLTAAGGTVVRRFYRMLIDFETAGRPEPVRLSDGDAIRTMAWAEPDLSTMHRIVDTAFEDHFGHEPVTFADWQRDTAGFCADPSLFWIATVDSEPAAALYGCELPESGYVDTLGTLREFRGRGLGRALLLTAFAEFARRGVRRVSLGVDATSPTGAVGLYESVGMAVAHQGMRYELPPAQGAVDG
jgi:mycothiol synthase